MSKEVKVFYNENRWISKVVVINGTINGTGNFYV